jgi:hypothetical protein
MSELPAPHTWKAPAHDPLCPTYMEGVVNPCPFCTVIAKVRADEQRWKPPLDSLVRANQRLIQQRADIRAQVDALREPDDAWKSDAYNAAIDDVLDLIDGGSDD